MNAELSQLPVSDGRKADRRIVNLAAALREEGARTAPVILVDISSGGFRADTKESFEPGDEVWLKLPGMEARRSRVIWAKDGEVGCEFQYPLHQAELNALLAPKARRIPRGVFRRV